MLGKVLSWWPDNFSNFCYFLVSSSLYSIYGFCRNCGLLSSGSALMAAHPTSFLQGQHAWQHTPYFFLRVNTRDRSHHLHSSGSTLIVSHAIFLVLGKHLCQHTPFPFFWVHSHENSPHLRSPGPTLEVAHPSYF